MKKLFLLITMIICLPGCVTSQAFKAYEIKKGEQVDEAKAGVIIFLQHWDFRAGVIKELLSSRESQLSTEAVTALKDINALSDKYQKEGGLTNHEYGQVLGLIMKVRYSITKKLLEEYLPSVFKYIPVVL